VAAHPAQTQALLLPGCWTPLFWAVWGGSPEVARLLLQRGADVNQKDRCVGMCVCVASIMRVCVCGELRCLSSCGPGAVCLRRGGGISPKGDRVGAQRLQRGGITAPMRRLNTGVVRQERLDAPPLGLPARRDRHGEQRTSPMPAQVERAACPCHPHMLACMTGLLKAYVCAQVVLLLRWGADSRAHTLGGEERICSITPAPHALPLGSTRAEVVQGCSTLLMRRQT
jgi:hypothetical protein